MKDAVTIKPCHTKERYPYFHIGMFVYVVHYHVLSSTPYVEECRLNKEVGPEGKYYLTTSDDSIMSSSIPLEPKTWAQREDIYFFKDEAIAYAKEIYHNDEIKFTKYRKEYSFRRLVEI